jgi:NitT/TauT family transport system substrate-binding protein
MARDRKPVGDAADMTSENRTEDFVEMICFQYSAARRLAHLAVLAITCVLASVARAETVRVGIVGASSDVPFFIADAKGYFAAEGLAVELMSFDSGAKMVAPLGTGDLDAGGGAASVGLYNAVKRGVGLKIVADKVHYGPGYGFASLLVRKELIESGKFKDYADLKGLRVAISGVGIGDESVLNEALKRGGLRWGDATPVYMGFAQHAPALANGAIDASITNEPTSTFIQRQGTAVRFAGNDEFYPNQQTAVLLYGEPFIKSRRETALKFMRAYIRAVRLYNDALAGGHLAGPNGPEVISILTRYSSIKDAELYRVITPPAIDPDGKVNVETLTKDWQFFRDTGQLDGKVTPTDIIDTSFAAEVVKELGAYVPR